MELSTFQKIGFRCSELQGPFVHEIRDFPIRYDPMDDLMAPISATHP
jgi:hypothetical protein